MTAQQVQEKAISADGTPIAWWRSGKGRPLVLVHGTTADHTRWRPVLDRFEPHAAVCAMDRRGRGASGDAEEYALEREYDDVVAVVDTTAEQSGGPVDVFGHSHGALCALEAARLTGNVRRLVLYEPPLQYDTDTYPSHVLDRLGSLVAEGQREEALALFFREVVGMPEDELATIRSLPAWQARVAAVHTLPREERAGAEYRFDPARLASVDVPTLLLRGSESPGYLQASTEAAAAALPDARIATLDGQQHVAIDTAPGLVADTVLSFLAEG
jgi:pimeloyl-ACP methyl ester carboxylesterase